MTAILLTFTISWWLIVGPPLLALAMLALGAFNIQWNFFLKATHHGDPSHRQLALTFDDGPHPVFTPHVLALLKAYGAQATFFCIGRHVAQHAGLVRHAHEQGHLVGNHSFTHSPTIDFHSQAKWLEELRQTDEAIAHAIGVRPRFFRPPYGVTTPHLAQAIKKSGHTVIGWRVRPYDTVDQSPRRIVRKVLKKTKAGDIILLHDTHDRIVPVLEQLLPELQKRGYTMVTIETLIRQHAYANT